MYLTHHIEMDRQRLECVRLHRFTAAMRGFFCLLALWPHLC
jgi:hypothetical protein